MSSHPLTIICMLLLLHLPLAAQDSYTTTQFGVERRSSSYFKERYQYNNLTHYLANLDPYTTYQSETTGAYNLPDQLIFSLEGSSHKWNNYYLDGFRIDSRFFAGSTLYSPDMYTHDLALDYIGSSLSFATNRVVDPAATVSYNVGGLGGISYGTKEFINLFHESATQRQLIPIEQRNQMLGAATLQLNYNLKGSDNTSYAQQLYVHYGTRQQVYFDQQGVECFLPERFAKLQLGGELPLTVGGLFDQSHYLLHYTQRDHLYAESYYGVEETAAHAALSASLYGTKRSELLNYTSGFTFAAHHTRHDNLNFSRNLIDHDGEAFDPWYTDGTHYELSHALNLTQQLGKQWQLTFDSYNSLLYNVPSATEFHNVIYAQQLNQPTPDLLYLYEWEAEAYASGLLENTLGVSTQRSLSPTLAMRCELGITLDAMLMAQKSMIRPNFEAQLGFAYNPTSWFDIELNLARQHVSFNIDDIRFLSDNYMNADIYTIVDRNSDNAYSKGERGTYFTSTGGAYHTVAKGLQQPSYWVVDIPIHFKVGHHTLTLLQSYRNYRHNWRTHYENPSEAYGYTTQVSLPNNEEKLSLFYLNGGEAINYVVDYYPEGAMGSNLLTSTPYYFCSNAQYQYETSRFTLIAGWQSFLMVGLSTLGSGPLHNNLGALSESSAHPNTTMTGANASSPYRAVGRLDQDRAYVARIFASYQLSQQLAMAINLKFTDGQPFSIMHTCPMQRSDGSKQLAIFPSSTRGINPFDGNFGTREDAIFNIDLRVTYRRSIAGRACQLQAHCYNLYDFGNEYTEYVFDQYIDPSKRRRAMSLSIPRGVILSLQVAL